jgi:hypothetical protein
MVKHVVKKKMSPLKIGAACACVILCYCTVGSFFFVTPSRHVSLCSRFGAVFNRTYTPGLYVKGPWTQCIPMFVQEQLDTVKNVQCGTLDGIQLEIPSIEIHNKLPADMAYSVYLRAGKDYDQLWVFKMVRFLVAQLCATQTAEQIALTHFNEQDDHLTRALREYQLELLTGLEIMVTKWSKPVSTNSDIIDQFGKRALAEAERTALMAQEAKIKQQNHNTLRKNDGVNALKAAEAKSAQMVMTLALDAQLLRDQKGAEAARIKGQTENLIQLEQAQASAEVKVKLADAMLEEMKRKAEGNEHLLTKEFIEWDRNNKLGLMSKVYYGPSVDKVFQPLHFGL